MDALAGGAAGRSTHDLAKMALSWFVAASSCNFCLGHCAGGTTAVFVSPLEVLKTRLQTQARGSAKYLGGIHIYGMLPSFAVCSCTSTRALFIIQSVIHLNMTMQQNKVCTCCVLHQALLLVHIRAVVLQVASSRLLLRKDQEACTEAWDHSLLLYFPTGR